MDEPNQHLPVPVTKLFGRDKNVAAVVDWLRRPDIRLVTITGLPGIGKTRLCIEVGWALAGEFADGTYFVPLNAISDPDLVVPEIARMLGVRESGTESPLEFLKLYLRDKQLLLLLDNFEQVLSAVMSIAALLGATTQLKIIVTSRTALHLSSEYEYMLSPLSLPELNDLPPLAELAQFPSVAMFVARAQAVKPDFVLTHANAPSVAQVCSRLDGIPLAIELAAARAKVLPPQALLTRLSHPLSVLTGGARDLPSRHQTLHRALEWSYSLLNNREQRLFRRMSVFSGGTSIEAAEAVCDEEGDLQAYILDDLSTLLDHSLLQSSENAAGEPRFTMLEMMREFAHEQLVASGELASLRLRHAGYYLRLAQSAETEFQGAQQGEWLERLEAEHDNLRAILLWSLEHDVLLALELATALWYFWFLRGHYSEGRNWLERTLTTVRESGAIALASGEGQALSQPFEGLIAKILHGLGTIAYYQSDYARARSWLEESLEIRQRLGDKRGAAASLNNLGNLAHDQSDVTRAAELYAQSLELRREIGDPVGVAASLSNLGNLALYRGDYEQAADFYTQSLALRRQSGDRLSISISLNNLGIVALHLGNYGHAALLYEESLAIKQELGDINGAAAIRNNLGELALYQGDYERAEAQFAQSLEARRRLGDQWGLSSVLTNMGASALHQGDHGRAVALLEESLVVKRTLGDRWSIANSLELLGRAALHLHDLVHASAYLTESLTLRIALEDKSGLAVSLAELAGVAAEFGNMVWAARLLGAAEALMKATGTIDGLAPGDRSEYSRTRATIERLLPPAELAAAENEGRSLSPEQILAQLGTAFAPDKAAALPDAPVENEAAADPGLTAREIEVLRLIVDGLSYSQIAERLIISARTVDAHLRSIYSKLQVRSRHEATRYALENHLVDLPR